MVGASLIIDQLRFMAAAGLVEIGIEPKDSSRAFIKDWAPGRSVEEYVVSASIEAIKP
ncbi:hypothetical protein [Candidatus Endoriftia persephone]|jgi:hypothetical protein|uniref:Uncharacterized protein n=3 Tax=Gammaproteobacteria TaxID=1236 RepID=G2FI77_9GAMM|nr:hypothetical protein [Candidatus Endoriftia persephone]EGV52386.1 hypothetical protein Rifp1Sym_aj00160 [endosymbiont of Riftia pachyptila (vent Ph05)]EGW53504.1 hypothetical protein TevJSym_ba00220 [endosymbiont of Tevnia jerichonana (vent Tica)]USF88556.1 hypothetical protein L0Y14_04790 [Candidatus Endoriftia persephone]